jgi:ABC-2 type transport system ATP-binding protein
MAQDGVTVFLTTHYIEEAEALCDRVAILNKGKLAAVDSPAHLRDNFQEANLEEVFLKLTEEKG